MAMSDATLDLAKFGAKDHFPSELTESMAESKLLIAPDEM